jgi:hypothetical protein
VTRDEHLAWCKRRALEYVDAGDPTHAVASMASDLKTHQPVFLDSSHQLLMSEENLGDACARAADVSIKCVTAAKHAEIIHSLFDGFSVPGTLTENTGTAEIIKDYCDRGYKLIDALQENVLIGNSVYGALKTSFAEVVKRNFWPTDWDATSRRPRTLVRRKPRKMKSY